MTAFTSDRIVARLGPSVLRAAVTAFLALASIAMAVSGASAGKRVAMVIGNSAYQHAPQLANPANDAADMASALRSLGFVVVEGIDVNNRGMRDRIREFASELRGAEVGMLFFAGHGLQVNGRNYLAPTDAKLEFETDLDFETIPLEFIQRQMEREVETILLFLDACRDNPLTRSFRTASRSGGVGKGLAEEKLSAAGTFIAFATNPGNVALDGKGRNSPFTKAMIDNIDRKDVEISTLMTDVRLQVVKETGGQQTPWINSSLLGRFYFAPASDSATKDDAEVASAAPKAQPRSSTALSSAQIEALAWETVKDTKDPAELEAFISDYGSGFYGKLARLRLQRLKDQAKSNDTGIASSDAEAGEPGETPVEGSAKASAEATELASLQQPEAAGTRKIEPEIQRDPREVKRDIQKELARLGCNPGRPDGLWGKRSQGALDRFARHARIELASAEPDAGLLRQLEKYDGEGCPVARTCPAGQRMNSKGVCFTPRQQARNTAPVQQSRSARQVIVRQQQPVAVQPQPGMVQQPGMPPQQVIVQQPGMPPQQVIVQQPGMPPQQVIVQQPQPVPVQPQPRNPISGLINGAGALIGGALSCRLVGC